METPRHGGGAKFAVGVGVWGLGSGAGRPKLENGSGSIKVDKAGSRWIKVNQDIFGRGAGSEEGRGGKEDQDYDDV